VSVDVPTFVTFTAKGFMGDVVPYQSIPSAGSLVCQPIVAVVEEIALPLSEEIRGAVTSEAGGVGGGIGGVVVPTHTPIESPCLR